MKEFLRFLMCVIIVAVLVFVYIFLNNQNTYYIEQMDKLSGDNENIISDIVNGTNQSGETNNFESGDFQKESGDTFSGDVENTESGDAPIEGAENIGSGDYTKINISGDNEVSGD